MQVHPETPDKKNYVKMGSVKGISRQSMENLRF